MIEIIIDELFKFYKKELTESSLLSSKSSVLKILYWLRNKIPILIPVIAFLTLFFINSCVYSILTGPAWKLYLILMLLILIPLGSFILFFNRYAKKAISKEYKVTPDKFIWYADIKVNNKISEIQKKKLLDKLRSKYDISKASDIKNIVDLTKNRADKMKGKTFRLKEILTNLPILLFPILTAFITEDDLSNQTILWVFISTFMIMIFLYFLHRKKINSENSYYNKMNELSVLLSEIYIKVKKKEKLNFYKS